MTTTKQKIKIEGYTGTWTPISERQTCDGHTLYLMEHDQHGEDVPAIIVDENNTLLLEDVLNGFSDYVYALESETGIVVENSDLLTRRVMIEN